MNEITCLECKHMVLSLGSPEYSEYTPGFSAEMYCLKSHWQYDAFNDGKKQVKVKLYTIRTCPDFKKES